MAEKTYLGNPLPDDNAAAPSLPSGSFINHEAMKWRLNAIENDRFSLTPAEIEELHAAWYRVFVKKGTVEADKQIKAMTGTKSLEGSGPADMSVGIDMAPLCRMWANVDWSPNVPAELRCDRKNFMCWVQKAAQFIGAKGFIWIDEFNLWYKHNKKKNVYEVAKNQARPDLLMEEFATMQAKCAEKFPEVAADTDFIRLLSTVQGAKFNASKRIRTELNRNVDEFEGEDDSQGCSPADMQLCTPAGTYDLPTGKLISKDNGLTLVCTAVAPDMDPKHFETSSWKKFLEEDVPEKAKRDYLQLAIGASLYGKWPVQAPILHMWHGAAGAGKSEIFNNIAAACGSYAATQIDIRIFTTAMTATERRHEQARLFGKRIGITGELGQVAWLSDDALKLIVSNDDIIGEEKYQRPFSFKNKCTLHMVSNYLPQVKNIDDRAVNRRLRAIEFKKSFTLKNGQPNMDVITDVHLPEKVAKEKAIILGWAMRGAMEFAKKDFLLTPPPVIEAETESYFSDFDWLTSFMDSEVEFEPDQMVPLTSLFMRFEKWAAFNGERFYQVNARLMAQKIRLHFKNLAVIRSSGGSAFKGANVVMGIRLKTNTEAALALEKQAYGVSTESGFNANAPVTPELEEEAKKQQEKEKAVIEVEAQSAVDVDSAPETIDIQTPFGDSHPSTHGGAESDAIREAVKANDEEAMAKAPISASGVALLASYLTGFAFEKGDIWANDIKRLLLLKNCPENIKPILKRACQRIAGKRSPITIQFA
ncbi:MAG: hypothetical protein IIZ04_01105 [Aeriscardovia sp.]|nr:hypothetical protein [Aeriscardovia sp.]